VQTCPADALNFGDLDDPNSPASVELGKHHSKTFHLLEEMNTRPRVFYFGTPPSSDAHEIERPRVRA
jgi:Fe-S-cluster-containing dehydrogenase component